MTGPDGLLDRFGQWLTAPARAERLALLRILVAGYGVVWLAVRAPHLRDVSQFADGRWRPVGVLTGLAGPPPVAVVSVIVLLALVSGLAMMLGWCHRFSGPTFALTLLLVTTWRNGWGQIFHTENLLVLHVIVLAVVPAAAAWSADARRARLELSKAARSPARRSIDAGRAATVGVPETGRGQAVTPESRSLASFGWPIRVMALITVSSYFVAGVAKIRYGGLSWLDGDVLAHQVAFDNLRKAAVGSSTSPVAGLLLDWRWLFTPMALATLAVEMGAPFALLSARAARLWAGAAWLFHLAIVITMVILFAYPLSVVALAPVLLVHGHGVPLPKVRRWAALGSGAGRRRSGGLGAGPRPVNDPLLR